MANVLICLLCVPVQLQCERNRLHAIPSVRQLLRKAGFAQLENISVERNGSRFERGFLAEDGRTTTFCIKVWAIRFFRVQASLRQALPAPAALCVSKRVDSVLFQIPSEFPILLEFTRVAFAFCARLKSRSTFVPIVRFHASVPRT